jgi:protein required for attachment to host cells
MAKRKLIVVANGKKVRFFRSCNNHHLEEGTARINPMSILRSQDFNTDKEGLYRESAGRSLHATEKKLSPKKNQATHFARDVSEEIERCCQTEDCDGLYIVAPPEMLGMMRPSLGSASKKLLRDEVCKDATMCTEKEIRAQLPYVL